MTPEKIERDRTAGTPGPWRVGPVDDTVVIAPDGSEVAAIDGDYNEPDLWPVMEANACRIARLPELEQAYLDLTAEVRRLTAERDDALALVAAAYEAVADEVDGISLRHWKASVDLHGDTDKRASQLASYTSRCIDDVGTTIRALTPADALAAQAARDERMRAEGRAEAETLIVELKHAIFWCGGSTDFSEGGQAREGWLKICMPLLGGSGQR